MEFLNDALVKQLKSDLFEAHKKEINTKINDLEKTFEENGYIILQPKYALYEINDCNKTFTVIIVAHDLAKELPQPSELYQTIRYGRAKNSDGSYKRNIKINVEESKNEIKKIFLGVLLHTRLNIKQPTANALTFAFNPSHKPTIKSGYLSLHLDYYDSVELLDEDNQIIDPDYYVPLDLVHICKDRSSVE